MIVFRHTDRRFVFLWEGPDQPAARWHGEGEGPVQYFVDTPDGAWAEFLRHEEIVTSEDVATIRRALWAVEVPVPPDQTPGLPVAVLTGGPDTYEACRDEARRLRARGAVGFVAPSAALLNGGERMAGGWTAEFSQAPRVRAA